MADDIALAVDEALKGSERRTRRDNFAMAALTGLLASVADWAVAPNDEQLAKTAKNLADKIIAELDKGEG